MVRGWWVSLKPLPQVAVDSVRDDSWSRGDAQQRQRSRAPMTRVAHEVPVVVIVCPSCAQAGGRHWISRVGGEFWLCRTASACVRACVCAWLLACLLAWA